MLPSRRRLRHYTQPTITCSKLTVETLEQRCEICSKLTIKPPKRRQWRRFGGFIVNFKHISHLCSSVSIVNFTHVIAGWVKAKPTQGLNQNVTNELLKMLITFYKNVNISSFY